MTGHERSARINFRVLAILVFGVGVLALGAAGAYYLRGRGMAREALAAGKAALEKQDWPEASRQLKIYLSKSPDDVEMLARYAEASLEVRPREPENVGAAIAAYRRLLRNRPDDIATSDKLIKLYFAVGNHLEVTHLCQRRLEQKASDVDATLWLARVLIAQRTFDRARSLLTELVKSHPERVEAYTMMRDLTLLEGADSPDREALRREALRWLDEAVQKNPKSPAALIWRARFKLTHMSDQRDARADLDTADGLAVSDPGLLLALAESWIDLGEFEKAKARMATVRQIEGDRDTLSKYDIDPDGLALVGFQMEAKLAMSGGEEERKRVADIARRATEELKGNTRAMFLPLAVELYLIGGKIEDARRCLAEYQKAAGEPGAADPQRAEQLAVLNAAVAIAEGSPYSAINGLEEPAARGARNPQVWKFLAQAYDMTDQPRRALWALEKYVERQGGDPSQRDDRSRRDLVRLSLRSGAFDQAWRHAQNLERTAGTEIGISVMRIQAMLRAGGGPPSEQQLREIQQALAKLRESQPKNVDVRVLQAAVAFIQRRAEEAVAILREAVEQCDDPLPAALRLTELLVRQGQTEQALEQARAATVRRSDVAVPRLATAELLVATNRKDEALATLKQAISDLQGKEKTAARKALIQYQLNHGARSEAIGLVRELMADQPGDVGLRLAALDLPEIAKDEKEVDRLINEIRDKEGERGLRWRFAQARAWLRREAWKQRQSEITPLLTRCMEGDPGWEAPVVLLGGVHESLGKLTEAEQLYTRFVDLYPEQLLVVSRLLNLLERQGRFTEQARILDRLPGGHTAELSGYRVRVALAREDYESAFVEVQQQAAAAPQDPAPRILLARLAYVHKKDVDGALKLLDQAEQLGGNPAVLLRTRVEIFQAEKKTKDAEALLDAEVGRRDDFATRLARADFYAGIRDFERAEREYKHLTTMGDQAPEGYTALGLFYDRAGRLNDAVAVWDAGLKIAPDRPFLQRLLAKGLVMSLAAESRRRGWEMLNGLLTKMPQDTDLLLFKADALLNRRGLGSAQEATAIYERIVEINPRIAAAHLGVIRDALARGEVGRGRELVARALGANPDNIELVLARAELEFLENNRLAARELAASVLTSHPDNIPARFLLARVALQNRDIETAQRFIEEAEKLDPNDPGVVLNRLRVLAAQKRFDEIIERLGKRLEAYPHEPEPLVSAASALVPAKGEAYLPKLKELLERFAQLNPDHVAGHLGLAIIASLAGDSATAEKGYRRVLQLQPDEQQALNNLAWLLAEERGRPEEALEFAERGVLKYAGDPHLLNTRGVVYFRLNLPDKARADLEKCLRLSQNLPSTQAKTLVFLGRIEVKKGDMKAAESAFNRALTIDRQHDVLTEEERSEVKRFVLQAGTDTQTS